MKLYEFEAKEILSKYGIPTPRGRFAATPTQAREIAAALHAEVAVKAQVLTSGRGKAGGILFASSPAEAERLAERLLRAGVKGLKVKGVLVEERVPIVRELYFGITIDRMRRGYVAVASTEGGMDIEEVALSHPERIVKLPINPLYGFRPYHARQIARKLGYRAQKMASLQSILLKLYQVAVDYDAELLEVNPLAETAGGEFIAVDARLILDDNALYRHPEFKERTLAELEELPPLERRAKELGLAYVELDGDIGVIGNGAGLVMATLDLIHLYGGRPANFLDIGGGASPERVAAALDLVLSNPRVRVVLINVLGGITRCDEIARGVLEVRRRTGVQKPIVIRLVGTQEEEGRRLLTEAGLPVLDDMEEAARQAVKLAHGG